jgi:YggT family protein
MNGVLGIIFLLLQIFEFILIARMLLSWFPNIDYSNPIIQFIFDITEPVLRPIRDLLPPTSGIDFSPLIVILIIQVFMRLLWI